MKTIRDELKSDIEDASAAGMLGNLPPAVAENDLHVTNVLYMLCIADLFGAVRPTATQAEFATLTRGGPDWNCWPTLN